MSGNDFVSIQNTADGSCQFVGTAHMSAEYRNDVLSKRVDTDNSRILVLVLDKRGYCPDADAHCTNEDKGIKL